MIDSFRGKYRFLSNFYPCKVDYEGIVYPSVEHAYQAAKTLDVEIRHNIANMEKPADAKRAGKSLELRDDWEIVKLNIMKYLVFYKFLWNKKLFKKLLDTNNEELVEGNNWGDTYWGICNGVGDNHLGHILMATRKRLKEIVDLSPWILDSPTLK